MYGLVPLESSSYGTIHAVYDNLLSSNGSLHIVGEIGLIEQHCLCVTNDSEVNELDIEHIYGHPHILDCCSEYIRNLDQRRKSLQRPPTERMIVWDSAASAELIGSAPQGSLQKVSAAVCSKEAALLHNLKVLVEGIGNDRNAETRYVVIARTSENEQDRSSCDPFEICLDTKPRRKCSIAMALRNVPGAIFRMSSCFAFRNVDIIKIESRPATVAMQVNIPNEIRPFTQRHWDLIFYLDFELSDQPEVHEALMKNLEEYCVWLKVLGAYRPGLSSVNTQPSEWTHIVDVLAC